MDENPYEEFRKAKEDFFNVMAEELKIEHILSFLRKALNKLNIICRW